ncbi:uncharacterized protein ACA1_175710 [Acanthamoeba castellanii str. Neff]|uniref:Frizzled/Smoothened family membrane region protein n=1 Tax=Acanthamoeba castellanii (strain ATCC 30010 / Neff) TaxID=1257118 RepID=L8HI64_ACACF|nr:uncharacterized protein ACA1_175710 [Acanthamoeba castellanii str. Neff]ELR24895.1 hypothetical protein ACA1_175710 [Acanthamoeba castellanii str. Neff]
MGIVWEQSYEEADAVAGSLTSVFGAFVPAKCRNVALQLICLSAFPVCQIGTTLSLTPPCRSVCENMWLECLPLVQSLNATSLMPDCDTVTLVDGVAYPAFPPDGIGIPCFPYSADVAVPYSQADCPYPLSYTGESERPEESCQLGCPAYIYGGEDEYWGSVAAIYMTTVPSMVLSFLMIITWLLNPSKRRYPAVLILWLAVSAFAVAFFINISVLVGGPVRTTCTWDDAQVAINMDNASENNGQGVVCIMQAIGTYYFGLTCNTWWLAITINIFLMLCFHKHEWVRRWSRYIHYGFHVFCWGVPLAGLITMLSMKKLGASGITPFCQILYDRDESWIDWVFYTAPILFCIFVGTILMVVSIVRFAVVQLKYERSRASELIHLFRLVLLVAFVWLNNVFYLAYRVHTEADFDAIFDSFNAQVSPLDSPLSCSENADTRVSLLTGTDCPYDVVLNYPFYIVSLIASMSTGACVFLTMCTTKSSVVLWIRLLSGLRHPRSFVSHVRLVIGSHAWSYTSESSSANKNMSSSDNPNTEGTDLSLTPPTSYSHHDAL